MNKKLLTVAVATALTAPVAALADVTVYGQMHMSLDYSNAGSVAPQATPRVIDNNGNVVDPGVISQHKSNLGVSSNSSRIGFKGFEDLGSGMKAIWQVESTTNLSGDAGGEAATGKLGDRNSFVGLAGGFGTALMGHHDTPFKLLGRAFDPFGDSIADTRQLLGNQGTKSTAWDLRPSNVVAYITPNFSGFSAALAYVSSIYIGNTPADGNGWTHFGADNNRLSAWSMNATYANGPIFAGAAYERHNIKSYGTWEGIGATPGSKEAKNPDAIRVGGSFSFGPGKVGAMWERLNDADFIDAKRDGGTIFGTFSFGMETAKLAYTHAGEWDVGGHKQKDTAASLVAVGLDHNFSKRTTAYTQYTKLINKSAAGYVLGSGGGYGDYVAPALGKDPSAISVGLIHKF